jgi:filamentous hemagglutinin family protein
MQHTLKTYLLATIITLSLTHATFAEVILDGTLGFAGALKGPDFAIEAHLGKQIGQNLFHSFDRFNLNPQESATFSGPNTINHIISRVTGGQASHINGLLRSKIPEANLYFINPAGIMFGEQARLDVQGSLHVSTADYLRLGEDGRFDATHPERSLLTVAPPSAFGFLDESPPAGISKRQSFLAVPNGKTLSFIGGDLTLQDNHLTGQENSLLWAPEGQINLVSVASSGEIPLNPETISDNAFLRLGSINIIDTPITANNFTKGANIDVSGQPGGKLYILGGQILMENAYVFADTNGAAEGQGITITATDEFVAKSTNITSEALQHSTGKGGSINLSARQLTLTDGTQLSSSTRSSGAAGDISVTATEAVNISGFLSLYLNGKNVKYGSGLLGKTTGTGQGGQIRITAPKLTLANGSTMKANTKGLGDAGDISLQVDTLTLTEGAQVNLDTGTQTATTGSGRGGTLTVTAKKAILITGQRSALVSNTFTAGEGGTITLKVPLLEVQDNGTIQAATRFEGKGGHISIEVDTMYLRQNASISTETWSNGQGGNIEVQARHISLTEGSHLTASSRGTVVEGHAGNLRLWVKDSLLMHNSFIKTETNYADGGDIYITSPGYLYLTNNSTITTSVHAIDGDGGNMTLKPEFIVLDNSRIKADASEGDGGNIHITTTGIYNFSEEPIEKLITASSELGVDGEIAIESPDVDLDAFLIVLPGGYTEPELPKPCHFQYVTERSTFRVKKLRAGRLTTQGDFMESLSLPLTWDGENN